MSKNSDKVRAKLKKIVERCCHHTIQSRFDLSDVVQEGMLQLFAANPNAQNFCEDTAWLARIGTGHHCKLQRQNLAQKRTVAAEQYVSSDSLPATKRGIGESAAALMDCCKTLDDESRFVVFRKFFDNQSYRKIAKELGTTPYHVKCICGDALNELKTKLYQAGIDVDG